MKLQKVKDQITLSRNIDSNSIVNTDTKEFNKYMMRKQVRDKSNDKLDVMENDLSRLKGEINEIKNLLKELVNGK